MFLIQAIFKFAAPMKWASHFIGQAGTRKISFRYSSLCVRAFDAVDAVKLEIPLGVIFSKVKLAEFPVNIFNLIISKT
jgi:hypothetical protein